MLTLGVAMWIVVPAPTRWLLPLGVGAPEVGAPLAIVALLALLLSLVDWRMARAARVASGIAALALCLSLSPLLQFDGIARKAQREMQDAFGAAYETDSAPAAAAPHRAKPLMYRQLFTGLPSESARVVRDVSFATSGGETLTMDIYHPPLADSRRAVLPVIVQVYGGAWQRGEPSDFSGFAAYFAARGYVVFALDYRHAPVHRFPAQLDDVRTALAWIGAHSAQYGADTSRMILLGRSAGAHLAMLAAYAPGAPAVRGVVSLYGPVDLAEGYRRPPSPDPLDVRAIERAFLGGTPDDMPDRYRDASPVAYASQRQPPTLLIYGGRDHIVESRFGRQLRDSLRGAGNTVVHVEIPWAEHAFDAVPNGPSAQLSLYVAERFIGWAVSGPNARPRTRPTPEPARTQDQSRIQ